MLDLIFRSESPQLEKEAQEYIDIWSQQGENILGVLEKVSGLEFKQKKIEVLVYEGPSSSGGPEIPMKLRASYSKEVKMGTLVHELGHRLLESLSSRPEGLDEHQTLNLFLYDSWFELFGKNFADMMVGVESERKGIYDYKKAWDWFLSLSKDDGSSLRIKLSDKNK